MKPVVQVSFGKLTLDGMVKVTVQCGDDSRSVWFGVGRRYRVEPILGDSAPDEGRVGVLEDLNVDTLAMRIRWDDTGRRGVARARFLVEVHERVGRLHAAAPRGSRVLSRARSQDRRAESADQRATRADSLLGHDAEVVVGRIEKRADRRPLCELCRDIHVRAWKFRLCSSCWDGLGMPPSDWVDDHLNDRAYQAHVRAQAAPARTTPW